MTMLHGKLIVGVHEASNLPVAGGKSCINKKMHLSNPYVQVVHGIGVIAETKRATVNVTSPLWSEEFTVDVCGNAPELTFAVMNSAIGMGFALNTAKLPVSRLINGDKVDEWLELGGKDAGAGKIHVTAQYLPADSVVRPDDFEVPNTYFKARTGNHVVPYQSAMVPEGILPSIEGNLGTYAAGSIWRDCYDLLNNAQRFIYICGWSVWTELKFLRDGSKEETLGELLKRKADEEGLRVCIMIWNEAYSKGSGGMMGTHDEETMEYFTNSTVEVANVHRATNNAKKKFIFTHHQKCVIADTPNKSVQAVLGGLDLTDGRWCTPNRSLFRTLNGHHKDDYHQCMFVGTTAKSGPRECWQDLASIVEGPLVLDVIQNFEERWRGQHPTKAHMLLNVAKMGLVSKVPDGCHEWTTQLFRSIDSVAADFKYKESTGLREKAKSGTIVERSIQQAYVHHIRRAKRFIYIENQYFMGSSQWWEGELGSRTGCENLIPAEVCAKIEDKINKDEAFAVYIAIPMWPEGDPEAGATQEIIHWEYQTINMMYRKVAASLKAKGSSAKPTDYLMFFCVGMRESHDGGQDTEKPAEGTNGYNAYMNRRSPIYIHSKGIFIDDEYFMMGSANINERSLNGTRDTEIAFGAWQPECIEPSIDTGARGTVHCYRMSLWAEYLGFKTAEEAEQVRDPHKADVVQLVQKIAADNWKLYSGPTNVDMTGTLLPYPYDVAQDGTITPFGDGKFLDTKALIQGCTTGTLPDVMTM